jgi:hypothetical protein
MPPAKVRPDVGQEFVSDPVAWSADVGVCRIFAPGFAEGVEIGLQFRARALEEWSHDAAARGKDATRSPVVPLRA